jgi:glycosyltransferase involved in cell wall biosynthesis
MWDWLLLVVFIIFSVSAAIQLFYYYYFYLSLNNWKHGNGNTGSKPVSVIICARNEASNLKEFLPSILTQDYHDFEVIVVNDCSEDDTYNVLGDYLMKYPNLKVSTINRDPKFTHNKKLAQLIGIKAARNEYLLFTDADCKPESDKWLANMSSHFSDKVSYILGYGGYIRQKGLLNAYIRYDTAIIAIQYFSMALRGFPYMGVGRNLAYRRSGFFMNNGFGIHSNLASGDDDLYINNNASRENTAVEFRAESHTRSVPASTLHEWISQKRRHLTTSPYYKASDKLLLVLEPLSRVVFYITLIALLSLWYFWIAVIAVFTARLATQIIVFTAAFKRLQEKGLLSYSLIFDIFSPFINSLLYIGKDKVRSKSQWR